MSRKDYEREYYRNRKIAGKCKCGENTEPGEWCCIACKIHMKHYHKKQYTKLKEAGICQHCSKNKVTLGIYCLSCWFKMKARDAMGTSEFYGDLWVMLEKQNFKCAYSGISIEPGINASIDHMKPRSKGGLDTLDNLVWCDYNVNMMKRDLTAKDFIIFCRKILETTNNDPDYFEIVDNRYKSPKQMWFDFDEDEN